MPGGSGVGGPPREPPRACSLPPPNFRQNLPKTLHVLYGKVWKQKVKHLRYAECTCFDILCFSAFWSHLGPLLATLVLILAISCVCWHSCTIGNEKLIQRKIPVHEIDVNFGGQIQIWRTIRRTIQR